MREVPGLDVLDERLAGAPGVFDYDPLRLAIDVRGTGAQRLRRWRGCVRERDDVNLELAGENVMVAVFGMGEDATAAGARLVAALRDGGATALSAESAARTGRGRATFAPPPPWGELAMTPREAFLGPQEVVPAREAVGPRGGRVARRLSARDPERAARASA